MSVCVSVLTRVSQIIFPSQNFPPDISLGYSPGHPKHSPLTIPWAFPSQCAFLLAKYYSSARSDYSSFQSWQLRRIIFHWHFNESLVKTHTTDRFIIKILDHLLAKFNYCMVLLFSFRGDCGHRGWCDSPATRYRSQRAGASVTLLRYTAAAIMLSNHSQRSLQPRRPYSWG